MATVATRSTEERGARKAGADASPRPTTPVLVDAYIVETLMPDLVGHDRQPSAFLVYLYLWRHTHAGRRLASTARQGPTGAGEFAVHCPWRGRGR